MGLFHQRLQVVQRAEEIGALHQHGGGACVGLGQHFSHVEIVSDKTPANYQAIFERLGIEPARFLMVGNSLRSDILPVTLVGARAAYIPYHSPRAHELVHDDHDRSGYIELGIIAELPALLEQI